MEQYYKGSRHKSEPINADDLTEIIDITVKGIEKHRSGAIPPKYAEDEIDRFMQDTERYFRHINEVNHDKDGTQRLIPSVESWCAFLAISRNTVIKYSKREGKWPVFIDYVKSAITASKAQLATSGKIPPILYIFDVANNGSGGYYNTNEFRVTAVSPGERKQLTNEEIRQQVLGVRRDDTESDAVDNGLLEAAEEGDMYDV